MRPASGTRRQQQTAGGHATRMGRPPMVPNPGLSANPSKPTFKRFNENEHSSNNEPGSSIGRKQSNRLLGNRQAFLN